MEALERREKDRQEIELEETFKSLMGKASGVDKKDIDEVASQTASEFRDTGKINIYKPTLRGNTPRVSQNNDGAKGPKVFGETKPSN